jgi:hypothetical protein
MPFEREDMAEQGVILIPLSAAEFQRLVADIEERLHKRPAEALPGLVTRVRRLRACFGRYRQRPAVLRRGFVRRATTAHF